MNKFRTLDDCIEGLWVRKVTDERKDLLNWMFEYACQTAEFEGITPYKSPKYIYKRMLDKLRIACYAANRIYESTPSLRPYKLNLDYGLIPELVRKEHGGGIPLLK